MKRINFIVAAMFFVFAVGCTVYTVLRFNEINNVARSIITAILMYFLSAVYAMLGFKISQRQRETIMMHQANYKTLKDMYDEIVDSDFKDALLKNIFCRGVHEFGILTFDIETGDYPQETKMHADEMLNDLMSCMAKII